MAKNDLGKAGGKAPSPVKQPLNGPKPRTGFGHAPDTKDMDFAPCKGFGGTNPGAH